MDNRKLDRDWFITELSTRAHFSKKDVGIILNTIIEIFTEVARMNATLKIRSFGKLYCQDIPARKGKGNIDLPPAKRIVFKLAENVRYSQKRELEQYE